MLLRVASSCSLALGVFPTTFEHLAQPSSSRSYPRALLEEILSLIGQARELESVSIRNENSRHHSSRHDRLTLYVFNLLKRVRGMSTKLARLIIYVWKLSLCWLSLLHRTSVIRHVFHRQSIHELLIGSFSNVDFCTLGIRFALRSGSNTRQSLRSHRLHESYWKLSRSFYFLVLNLSLNNLRNSLGNPRTKSFNHELRRRFR